MSDDSGLTLSALERIRFEASKAASDQARTLALAGVGIVWLFAGPFFVKGEGQQPSDALFFAGGILALALALDLGQLLVRALLLERAYNNEERRPEVQEAIARDKDPVVYDLGPALRRWTTVFFFAKFAALAMGYGAILAYFVAKVA